MASLDAARAPHPSRIAVVSAGILILELAFIRLIPAEVRAIAYFTNLILMAAFFGLGLGCILSRQPRSLGALLPVGLALVLGFVLVGRGIVVHAEAREVHYWLHYTDLPGEARKLPLFPAAAAAFALASLPFVALGQALAREMDHHARLTAYGWDIAGSLAGVLVFSASSLLRVPPWLWPPLVAAAAAALFARRLLPRAALLAAGAGYLLLAQSPFDSSWSPYYYVQTRPQPMGLEVWVNSTFLQVAIDFTDTDPARRAEQERAFEKWSVPYDKYRELHGGASPRRVLVLGAGTGNDVNVALRNGAERVVAVEIDPVVLELGRRHNTLQPYADPRVHAVVDDARHYLQTTRESFDLVIYGTIDSVALVGTQANLRLENYVHTRESLEAARERLAPGGMVGMYYSTFQPWMWGRIYSTVREVFGEQSAMVFFRNRFLFDTALMGARDLPALRANPALVARYGGARPSTDDWPFMYLERPMIAPVYLQLMAVVGALIAAAFWLLRRLEPARGELRAGFLLLGLGFTLLESGAIVRLSLLFGSTWTVNVVVFSSALLMVFLANWSVQLRLAPSLRLAWPGLVLMLLVNWAFPLPLLLELGSLGRAALSGLLIGTPIYFASVCFSRLFETQSATGYALGINLIGAMAGGLLEYVSMIFGMRSIWLALAVVYGLAWASALRFARSSPTAQPIEEAA